MLDSATGTLPTPAEGRSGIPTEQASETRFERPYPDRRAVAGGLALLLFLAIPLFFVGIEASGLSEPDEPYYAVPALEMLRTGSWQVPVFRGNAWFDKPVLYYWVVMASYALLGVSDGAARIGAALAGLGGVLSVFLLARRRGADHTPALVSATVLATSVEYAIVARLVITDMLLTFFITLGMLAAARHLESRSRTAVLVAGTAFGFAILTKGPVGILLPCLALVAYLTLVGRWGDLRWRDLSVAGAGLTAVAVPWYAYMALAHRDLLVKGFIGEGNVGRFLEPEHPAFPLYYVVVLVVGLLPWSGALPVALFDAARPTSWRSERGSNVPGTLFHLCWFGAVLAVFSFSASKLPTYILPAFPAAALLVGHYWTKAIGNDRARSRRLDAWSIGLSVALAATTVVGLGFVARKPLWSAGATPLRVLGLALLVGAAFSAAAYWRRSLRGWVAGQAAASVVAIVLLVGFAYPLLEPFRSTRDLVADLDRDGALRDVVAAYRIRDYSIDFYMRRTVPRIETASSLRATAEAEPGKVWILRSVELATLAADPALIAETVQEGPRWSAVRIRPAPDRIAGKVR